MAIYGTLGEVDLGALDTSIADTAVDVFVYDTRKDSDGGQWRHRCQHTSWYNETLNTATRGARREFPAVAVIVSTGNEITIYDGDDPDMPMWMYFQDTNTAAGIMAWINVNGGSSCVSISMLNGKLSAGFNSSIGGLYTIDFLEDTIHVDYTTSLGYSIMGSAIDGRNTLYSRTVVDSSRGLVNRSVNDVAMTVLPNAPIDDATGLPTPTIAVATDSGTSIIKDDGTVADLIGFNPVHTIHIDSNSVIGSVNTGGNDYLYKTTIPSGDAVYYTAITAGSNNYYMNNITGTIPTLRNRNVSDTAYNSKDDTLYRGGNNGFDVIKAGQAVSDTVSNSIISYITSDYNTGWMHGDIKGAFLSDTDDTDKTNGQTDPDRSVNNYTLTVTGTVTKTPVATGADLVAYSGWSSSNYMDNTSYAVNFGNPVTISIVFWQKITDIADYSYGVSFSAGTSVKGGISNGSSSSGYGGHAYFNMGSQTLYTGSRVDDGNWHCLVGTVSGTAKKFYLDGREVESATIDNYDMSGISRIHVGSYGINHAYAHRGSLALLRVSKSVPSAEQIKKMYEDEKVLFQEGSACTLYGSSDAVTALAFDDTTSLLHVGTSSGRSEFKGLRRVTNTTTPVATAISASNGLVAEQ